MLEKHREQSNAFGMFQKLKGGGEPIGMATSFPWKVVTFSSNNAVGVLQNLVDFLLLSKPILSPESTLQAKSE